MNTLTIVTLVILAVMTWIGWHKGLLRMLFSFSAVLLSLILTMALAPKVDKMLENTDLYHSIHEKYNSYLNTREEDLYVRSLAGNIEEAETVSLKSLLVSIKDRDALAETAENAVHSVTDEAKQLLSERLAQMSVKAISFLITWITIGIAIKIILGLIKIIEKLPLIHGTNKLAGLLLGFLCGLLMVWILFAAITVTAASPFGSNGMKQIADSTFLSILYRNNFILKFLK